MICGAIAAPAVGAAAILALALGDEGVPSNGARAVATRIPDRTGLTPVWLRGPRPTHTLAATPARTAHPTPQVIVVSEPPTLPATAPPSSAPPTASAPPIAKPSALSKWNECQSTWNQGNDVEAIKNTNPGLWNSDYESQYQSLIRHDQSNCIGIGGALAETDGNIHCPSLLSSAAAFQAQMQQIPGLQSWYFPPRALSELHGYTNAAGC